MLLNAARMLDACSAYFTMHGIHPDKNLMAAALASEEQE